MTAGSHLFAPATPLRGRVRVPGDKSISHRALLLGAVNAGPVEVTGFLPSADTLATLGAVRALGVRVEETVHSAQGPTAVRVHGEGWEGLAEPLDVIDVANAGTLMRLLPGLLASLPMFCVLTGDASIRRRPMRRIVEPLRAMGAWIEGREDGSRAPLALRGGPLQGLSHQMPVASAQVKSCLLLAGLRAEGETRVVEPGPSRDHTERLIRYGGGVVEREGPLTGPGAVSVRAVEHLRLGSIAVPGDLSSAAFLLVAALLVPGSEITVHDVGLNPTRAGLLEVLQTMGADLEVRVGDGSEPEPRGAVTARSSELTGLDLGPDEVPLLIDELPIWALAAARARGTSRLRGAAELRVKESDRLATVAALLRGLGVEVSEYPDGLDIVGRPSGWDGGRVASHGDHRLAMTGAVAGLASRQGVVVDDLTCADVSFPGFAATIASLLSA
jgi:3-phosphoshikimate 1-carboxyvinyltransferase